MKILKVTPKEGNPYFFEQGVLEKFKTYELAKAFLESTVLEISGEVQNSVKK